MQRDNANASALGPYRILDLTEEGYLWCGRLLADLGADVIKIEPPEGSNTRTLTPLKGDIAGPHESLFWWEYCLNKRSVTLDIESPEGRSQFLELAASADVVLESFAPGYLEGLGIGYESLRARDPGIIVASMTPFGQSGPYADYKATDIVCWSMGGMQYASGDEDRPPVRVSFPQAQIHAGAQAAAGTMIALWQRHRSGAGQRVDVSAQEAVIWSTMNVPPMPALHGEDVERGGGTRKRGGITSKTVFGCKDGFLSGVIGGGLAGGRSMTALVRWMDSAGFATEAMKARDWPAWDLYAVLATGGDDAAEFQAAQARVAEFFSDKSKAEIFDRAVQDSIIVAPCNTPVDIGESVQLAAREFWTEVQQGSGAPAKFPGPYVKLSETPLSIRRPVPSVGQHNEEVFSSLSARDKGQAGDVPDPPSLPFVGLKVLDLSWVAVGPLTMKYLADHGATVIRVESVTRPDPARSVPPFGGAQPGFNRSQFPANFNTSKHGLGLNLTKPEARDLIRLILREWRPDILAESFTPKAMKGWGLDYLSVREFRPDIVYYSTCQTGQYGPHAMFGGYGGQAAAMAGFFHLTGWPDREPAGTYGAYTDFVNPPNGLAAVVSALEFRRRTGKGQHIDLSQFECAVHYSGPAVLDYTINGRLFDRRGNLDDAYVPHNVYPCKQRNPPRPGGSWCAIAVTSDEEWKGLLAAMGDPGWGSEPRFATFAERKQNEADLDRLIGEWTTHRDAGDVMRTLQKDGVPAGVVQAASDLWEDPQLKHRNFFRWLEHTECGAMPYNGPQFLLSETPSRMRWAAPLVGEHNELVLKDFLGLSDDAIADLAAAGALETSF